MDNKDMPAMPTGLIDEDVLNEDGECCGWAEAKYTGLTKREHFAGLAMQAILSNPSLIYRIDGPSVSRIATKAAIVADALLAQLDKGDK